MDRPTSESWGGTTGVISQNFFWVYDAAGRMTIAHEGPPTGSMTFYSYAYDNLDRNTVQSHFVFGSTYSAVSTQTWDIHSRRDAVTYTVSGPGGIATNIDFTNDYVYDAVHRVDAISQFAATAQAVVQPKLVDYEYNLAGDRTTLTRYSDLAGTQLVGTTTYAGYDGVGRLTAMTHTDGAGALIASYNMGYDRAHRLVTGSHANRYGNQTQAYTYDAAGQLTSAVRTGTGAATEIFSYDTSGNRTGASGVAYTNTNNNRIVSDGVYSYYYDDEGNLIRRIALVGGQPTGWTRDFQWDQRNRLVGVIDRYGGPSAPINFHYTYRYDSFDRRVFESHVVNGANNYFFYDGEDVAMTIPGNGGWGSASRWLHGPAVDEILAREEIGAPSIPIEWAYTDHLGSVRDVVANNFVTSHMDYNAFGGLQGGAGWYYGFTGREYDHDTGLNYHRARWLDPQIGRWINEDPIGFAGGDANLNRYVGNQATFEFDPSGQAVTGAGEKNHRLVGTVSDEDTADRLIRQFKQFSDHPNKLYRKLYMARGKIGIQEYELDLEYVPPSELDKAMCLPMPTPVMAAPAASAIGRLLFPAGKGPVTTGIASALDDTPRLSGQMHHGISVKIARELDRHPILRGVYQPRDPRFVTQACDLAAHNGYQKWHRQLDKEVVKWLQNNQATTQGQFETWLRWRYNQPDLKALFPNGL